jgi:hypothetical protein
MPVLTGIDVLGVQRYVFASNRLRDAVAASWLVHWATGADGALHESGGDVLLASGGNAILCFPDRGRAHEFVTRYTRRVYDDAPGLEVVVAHEPFHNGGLATALGRLQVKLANSKLERTPATPLLGLSVTAGCDITGLPATGIDPLDARKPLSRMVLRWRDRDVHARAIARWDEFLDAGAGFALPPEIDDMGRTRGDTSLIGVVHIDGNGIGERIATWQRQCVETSRSDDAVGSELRGWAAALDSASHRSLEAVIKRVAQAIDERDRRITGAMPNLGFKLGPEDGPIYLPFRPVLLGGDDLTFLCDGRIALHLAEVALDSFSGEVPSLGTVTACAGVALVPAHTPFDRAYELADALCGSAKARRRHKKDSGCWLDWHIGAPRPGEGVDDLRRRAFTHRLGNRKLQLTCRPYRLGTNASERETWRWLARTVIGSGQDGFRGERWSRHRNKLKELASVVREGTDGVRWARESWTAASGLAWPGGLDHTNGFLDEVRTPLLDAIELLDIHLPLEEESAP